jgi:hypothetical protein
MFKQLAIVGGGGGSSNLMIFMQADAKVRTNLKWKRVWICFSLHFAFNLITFHVCPCKYLYKQLNKYYFTLSIQSGRFHVDIHVFEGWPECPEFCTTLYIISLEIKDYCRSCYVWKASRHASFRYTVQSLWAPQNTDGVGCVQWYPRELRFSE